MLLEQAVDTRDVERGDVLLVEFVSQPDHGLAQDPQAELYIRDLSQQGTLQVVKDATCASQLGQHGASLLQMGERVKCSRLLRVCQGVSREV